MSKALHTPFVIFIYAEYFFCSLRVFVFMIFVLYLLSVKELRHKLKLIICRRKKNVQIQRACKISYMFIFILVYYYLPILHLSTKPSYKVSFVLTVHNLHSWYIWEKYLCLDDFNSNFKTIIKKEFPWLVSVYLEILDTFFLKTFLIDLSLWRHTIKFKLFCYFCRYLF